MVAGGEARGVQLLMARCDYCQRSITWALTEANGKRMPIDTVPVENPQDGNLVIVESREVKRRGRTDRVPVVRVVGPLELPGQRRYVSHFATCPNKAAIAARRASRQVRR